jgi:hypothetical protein
MPPKICKVIGRLYNDLKVIFVLGKHKVTFHQSVGVRQGDNMAPVLFLFLMAAFHDLLELSESLCSKSQTKPLEKVSS